MPITNVHAGALRSVTCMAMEDGATLVSVPRDLFISFIAAKPRTLPDISAQGALASPAWPLVDCDCIFPQS